MANFGTILVPKETDFAIKLNEYYVTKWRNYSNWKHMYKFPTKHFWSQKPCDICGATIIAFLLNGDFYCDLRRKPNLLQTKHADSMRWSYYRGGTIIWNWRVHFTAVNKHPSWLFRNRYCRRVLSWRLN